MCVTHGEEALKWRDPHPVRRANPEAGVIFSSGVLKMHDFTAYKESWPQAMHPAAVGDYLVSYGEGDYALDAYWEAANALPQNALLERGDVLLKMLRARAYLSDTKVRAAAGSTRNIGGNLAIYAVRYFDFGTEHEAWIDYYQFVFAVQQTMLCAK